MQALTLPEYLYQFELHMQLCKWSENTKETYRSILLKFLGFCFDNQITPHDLDETGIKEYLIQAKSSSYLKQQIGVLRNFYEFVIKQQWKVGYIPLPKQDRKLPDILSEAEIVSILKTMDNPKHQFIFLLFYSTGMRISEILNLKNEGDIDVFRNVIHIRAAKGKKDRLVPLDAIIKDRYYQFQCYRTAEIQKHIKQRYYTAEKKQAYLFVGQFGGQYTEASINTFLKKYAKQAGINKKIHAHLLRHTYGTHMREKMIDLETIAALMGHKSTKTTQLYAQLSNKTIQNAGTPLSGLDFSKPAYPAIIKKIA